MVATAGVAQLENRTRGLRSLLHTGAMAALAYSLARLPVTWSAAALAGTALVLAVLILPAVGLAAIALAIPFGGLLPLPLPVVGPVDLLVGLVTAAWLAQGIVRRRIIFHRPPLAIPLLAFVWLTGLSLTQAMSWREGLPEWLKWVEFAGVYLVGCQLLTGRSARGVVVALLVAGSAEALLGAYQFVRQVGPEAFILLGRFMRAHGTFQQPNPYAGYLGYLLPVAASLAQGALASWWHDRTTRRAVTVGLYGVAAGLLALGILMSWSRGAWLGAAASAVVVVGFRNRRTALLSVLALLLLILVITVTGTTALPGFIGDRLNDLGSYFVGPDPARTEITDANFSVLERLAHWQAGWRMFEEHPWLGVGIGNYAVAYPIYHLPLWYEPLGHAHNVFINFLAETGILGLGAFVVFWLLIPALLWRRAHAPGAETWAAALSIGVLGTWAYITVHSLFDNLFVQHIQLQLALLLCTVVAATAGARHTGGKA
jgi:putative inorganic carbon (hco3(-)) transporter